jgi:hypothetical protein
MRRPWFGRSSSASRSLFERPPPFIGYVQFLYEAQLRGGQKVKGLQVDVDWWLGGKHHPPKDEGARKGREVPWRFKAP